MFVRGSIIALSLFLAVRADENDYEEYEEYNDGYTKLGCTAVIVGPGATVDGSLITTHNADCLNCDYRIARTPARYNPPGSKKKILKYKPDYPHYITDDRSSIWRPENIDDTMVQKRMWATEEYMRSLTLGVLPEVEETYAMVEGLFGIMNEKGLAIGESTCGAIWYGKPPRACPDCEGPQIDMSFLTIIALERCATARCAIEMMSGLASSLGYYAADTVRAEGGEGLTIIDNTEAWVYHILPTEDGDDVIWVAQRVPDTHVTAIANQFIIREVDPDSEDFLYSDNLWSAPQKAGLWNPEDGLLDFAKIFIAIDKGSAYSTRRQWRVMDIVAPSKNLPSEVDRDGDGLPFSVEVDRKITVRDVMAIKRDYYAGTKYDLSKGVAAGPYGDPRRFDGDINTVYNGDNLTLAAEYSGGFERAISMMRTSYSQISVSRPPKEGFSAGLNMVWVAQYAPHMAVYTPIYVNAGENAVPKPLSTGSLWHYDTDSVFWRACAVGNWAAHFFKYAIVDVRETQKKLEDRAFDNQARVEAEALAAIQIGDKVAADSILSKFSADHCDTYRDTYNELFNFLIAKYHDGYSLADPNSFTGIDMRRLFYPKWWLKVAGFWTEYDFPPDDPHNPKNIQKRKEEQESKQAESSEGKVEEAMESNVAAAEYLNEEQAQPSSSSFMFLLVLCSYVVVAGIAGKVGMLYGQKNQAPNSPNTASNSSVELGYMNTPAGTMDGGYQTIGSYQTSSAIPQTKASRVQLEL
jgi:dipeptidase